MKEINFFRITNIGIDQSHQIRRTYQFPNNKIYELVISLCDVEIFISCYETIISQKTNWHSTTIPSALVCEFPDMFKEAAKMYKLKNFK